MSQSRPNIVYVLADDLGYGDLSCLNPDSKITTPRHDELASQGMTFTDAHSNSAVCTPTRYGVLTGRYCWRGVLKKGVLGGYDDLIIEEGRETVASLLQGRDYRTACIGKWHLGLGWQRQASEGGGEGCGPSWEDRAVDFGKPVLRGPHTVGFDYSFIIPSSLDITPYCYIENGVVVEEPTKEIEGSDRPAFWRGGQCAPGLEHETCLLEFTMRAEQFIADHALESADKPFFLYLPLPSPHTPHVPRKPFQGKSEAGVYGDFVVEHDWSLGRVLDTLERNGLADNTLVIVTSDNGAHMRGGGFDFERDFGHRSNHIFRGQKSDCWDGGHRVPFLVRWPGIVEAGSTCDTTVCHTDLLACVATLAGAELPSDAGEDSFDISPLLRGEPLEPARPAVIHHGVGGDFALRDGRWKFVEPRGAGGWSLPEKDVPGDAPPHQLYDMQDDPEEQHNLFHDRPEIVEQLTATLERMRTEPRSVG